MSVLFTAKEIKELREHINKKKFYSNNKELENLNSLYNAMYKIEREHTKKNNSGRYV